MGVLVSHTILLQSSDGASDAQLVARAIDGDRWGREMLYRRHATYLLAIAARLLGNRGDGEEVVQDTFVTAFEHCRTGGVALFVPDEVRETFEPTTDHGGHDAPDRGLRYLEWTTDPDASDTWYVTDYAFLLRLPDGSIDVRSDRHVCGLFPRATWLAVARDVGFEATAVPLTHEGRPQGAEGFVGIRPA